MASFNITYLLLFVIYFGYSASSSCKGTVRQLTADDWTEMTQGQWMVKFYAPWCPACRSLTPTWENLAKRIGKDDYCVGKVDVTENPTLSGRFFVTALPTIYHIKDGVFRQFRGARSEQELIDFAESKWEEVDPVPWYYSPTSYHMAALGAFFQFSMSIKALHQSMMTDYGIPVWGSYLIFALATILFGLFLGLLIVCLCDMSRPQPVHSSTRMSPDKASKYDEGDNSDMIDDDDKEAVDKKRDGETTMSPVRHREPHPTDQSE